LQHGFDALIISPGKHVYICLGNPKFFIESATENIASSIDAPSKQQKEV
jgi:hypothetical protein